VLDDEAATREFTQWLDQHARRADIRKLVGTEKDKGGAYSDAIFHRGGLASRLKLTLSIQHRTVRRMWFGLRSIWFRLRS